MGLKQCDFLFDLPNELIAQTPLSDRSASRLLKLNKDGCIHHGRFVDIIDELNSGDCLILNETKVIPARLRGVKESFHGGHPRSQEGGAQIELLLLKRLNADRWEALVRPRKRIKRGDRLVFSDGSSENETLTAIVEESTEDGSRIVCFKYNGVFEQILDRLGETPLPPYIHRRLEDQKLKDQKLKDQKLKDQKLEDRSRYQTVYAKYEGSAAAPTAGLHFTEELLDVLVANGVNIARITLHVGLGTFRPVTVENILDHKMHSEFYQIEPSQAQIINSAKDAGARIIAVGTTVCRTLETCAEDDGCLKPGSGWTDIFIYPGYKFKIIDGLITNFHLPGSTLIMLVSALAGRENVLRAYEEAVKERYRFYSFGDAMLIL